MANSTTFSTPLLAEPRCIEPMVSYVAQDWEKLLNLETQIAQQPRGDEERGSPQTPAEPIQANERLLVKNAVNEACTQKFTPDEQAFCELAAAPDMPEKQVYFNVAANAEFTRPWLNDGRVYPWPFLPEEVRPLIAMFGVITKLAWLEVALTIICAVVSTMLSQVLFAQVCLFAGFVIAIRLKLQALRTMTSSDKLLCGEVVSTFLNEKYSIGGMRLPVPRFWVLTISSLPSFAEGALTAIALPHAYHSSPSIAMALGLVLAWSSAVQVIGTRRCILTAKHFLYQCIFHALYAMMSSESQSGLGASGCSYHVEGFGTSLVSGKVIQDTNNIWHWLTMAAASSNLSLIAACGDQVTNKTKDMEPFLVYKVACHDEHSVATRVVNRFVLTAAPRMALKAVLFGRMGSSPVTARLNMLLAILTGMINIFFLSKKVMLRVYFKWQLMKQLDTMPPESFPDNSPPGTFSRVKVFLNPFVDQSVQFQGDAREISFDGSVYAGLAMLLYMLWSGCQLLPPVQQLIHDCF